MSAHDPRTSPSAVDNSGPVRWAPPGPGRDDAPPPGSWNPNVAHPGATFAPPPGIHPTGAPGGPAGFMHPIFTPVPWNRRALGYIIDFGVQMLMSLTILIGMIMTMVHMFSTQSRTGAPSTASIGTLMIWDLAEVLTLIPFAYFQIYQRWIKGGPTGQSLGRRVAKTRLVDARTGQPIGIGMTIVRDLAHAVDGLPIYLGYLWPLWDKQRRTFADMLVHTVVVDEKDAPLHVVR